MRHSAHILVHSLIHLIYATKDFLAPFEYNNNTYENTQGTEEASDGIKNFIYERTARKRCLKNGGDALRQGFL